MTSQKKTTETTLTQLTKRFVKLLNSSSERVINLNEASSKLSVAKRRIYDITNVLEGIGLLQKTSKNVTRWIDCPSDSPLAAPHNNNSTANNNTANNNNNNNITTTSTTINATTNLPTLSSEFTSNINNNNNNNTNNNHHHQYHQNHINGVVVKTEQANHTDHHQHQHLNHHRQLHSNGIDNGLPDAELVSLLKTYQALEDDVNELQAQIRQTMHADSAYVTYQDIKSFFLDEIVIAVKAPPNTVLEVDENLLIRLKSEGEEIEVYLCPQYNNDNNNFNNNSSNNTNCNNTTLAQPAPPQPSSQPQPVHQQHQPQQQQQLQSSQQHQQQQQQHQPQATQLQPATTQPHPSQSQNYGLHYDTTTSGISTDDHYYTNNDPTLSSALSSGEEEDPYSNIPIVPAEGPHYNFMLEDNYTLDSLFPDDDHGIF